MDDLIRKSVSTGIREPLTGCADENIMAAYLEGNLSAQEKAAFEGHAAQCASCQEILALSMKLKNPDASEQISKEGSSAKKTLFHFSIPIPVLGGGIAVIILIVVLFKFLGDSRQEPGAAQIAELHQSAREAQVMKQNAPLPQTAESRSNLTPEPPATETDALAGKLKGLASRDLGSEPQAIPPAAPVVKTEEAEAVEPPALLDDVKVAEIHPAETAVVGRSRSNERLDAASSADTDSEQGDKFQALTLNAAPSAQLSSKPQKEMKADLAKARSNPDAAGMRQVGEKEFYRNSGIWIDRQCALHPDDPIIEIDKEDPEYKLILEQYPKLRDLLPAKIYWNGKTYLLH
jgi:hypothetical protein